MCDTDQYELFLTRDFCDCIPCVLAKVNFSMLLLLMQCIQPENIFIKNDQYKLGDFGLVSKIENHDNMEEGDSWYMSMELLSGDWDDLTKLRLATVSFF